MKDVFSSWPIALRYIFKDPINFILFIIPALLSILIYIILGYYFLTSSLDWAQSLIFKYVVSKNNGMMLYYVITGLLMFLFYLLVSWTFILLIGLISAPFNDIMSRRIEQKMRGIAVSGDRSKTIKSVFSGILKTLVNELKKILVILIITAIATVLNFIPILYPIALILLALLMSSQYLDYTWSRHDMPAGQCFKDLLKFAPSYALSGMMFLVLIAVPFINALVPAIATSYYTVLWNKRQAKLISA